MSVMLPTAPAVEWKTVNLPDGSDLQVAITPPNLKLFLDGQWGESNADILEKRLRIVTGWRGVYTAREGGGKAEVPFTQESLVLMLRTYHGMVQQLADIVRPMFVPVDEATEKNFETPSSAATQAESNPSTLTATTDASNS